jgi:hypothetical protein
MERPDRFTPATYWIGSWMGSRASLDAVVKKRKPCTCRESNSGRPVRSLATALTEVPRLLIHKRMTSWGSIQWVRGALKLTIHLHPVSRLRMHGSIPPLRNTFSWCGASLSTWRLYPLPLHWSVSWVIFAVARCCCSSCAWAGPRSAWNSSRTTSWKRSDTSYRLAPH